MISFLQRRLNHILDLLVERQTLAVTTALRSDIVLARQRRALEETVDFVERYMPHLPYAPDRLQHLADAFKLASHDGMICEFGIFKGESVNHLASLTDRVIHGFDSFEGLPESWNYMGKGAFAINGLPPVRSNVRLYKGWFSNTIAPFLDNNKEEIAFLHIDSDLYSSAVEILRAFAPRIRPGTIIVFDEFFNYYDWKNGEYKAFTEFVERHNVQFEYLSYVRNGQQVALKILSLAR